MLPVVTGTFWGLPGWWCGDGLARKKHSSFKIQAAFFVCITRLIRGFSRRIDGWRLLARVNQPTANLLTTGPAGKRE